MTHEAKTTSTTALRCLALLCALVVAIVALVPPRPAWADTGASLARRAVPETEPDLVTDVTKLSGSNWMAGISGARYLHEINIPGTHDSAMWNPKSPFLIQRLGAHYACTQNSNMTFVEQLKAGVRLFDLRLTNVYPSGLTALAFGQPKSVMDNGDQGLYFVHGPHNGRLGDWRFYARNADRGTDHYEFDQAFADFSTFLANNPTETIILDLARENDSGNKDITLARTREYLLKYGKQINPATGKTYLYMPDGQQSYTTMPQLGDCRGQIVVISTDNIGVGMQYGWAGGHSGTSIGNVSFYSENHFEEIREEKVKRIQEHLSHYDSANGLPRAIQSTALSYGAKMSTASNRALGASDSPHQDPEEIAEVVNPACFASGGMLTTTGSYYGWVYSDMVTNEIIRTLWKTNFPDDLVYKNVTYKATVDGKEKVLKTVKVLDGTTVTLPVDLEDELDASVLNGESIVSWNVVEGGALGAKNLGDTITINTDTVVEADLAFSWASLQKKIDNAQFAETIKLPSDVTARKNDKCLMVNKTIFLNLNGHTLNRNASVQNTYGSVLWVANDASLTITGQGKITGGNALNAGGIWVQSGASLTINGEVSVEGNTAERDGGGIYVGDAFGWDAKAGNLATASCTIKGGATVTGNAAATGGGLYLGENASVKVDGASITQNEATSEAGGVFVHPQSHLTFAGAAKVQSNTAPQDTSTVASNVYLPLRSYVSMGTESQLTEGAHIGITTEETPTASMPAFAVSNFSGDEAAGRTFFASDNETYGVGRPAGSTMWLALFTPCTVRFDTGMGTVVASQTVAYGGTATKPADPKRPGYVLDYWYDADDASMAQFDFGTSIKKDTTLRAKWKRGAITCAFGANGGTFDDDSAERQVSVDYGATLSAPDAPTREGYTFKYWSVRTSLSSDAPGAWAKYDFSNPVYVARWFRAEWEPDASTHTVAFVSNDATVASQEVTHGGNATLPEQPTSGNDLFAGWYDGPDLKVPFSFASPINQDTTVWAKWVERYYDVTFVSNGGTEVATQQVTDGSCAKEPTAPTREGYAFDGWYEDAALSEPYSFGYAVSEDLILYAKWVSTGESYTVTFVSDGETYTQQTVKDQGLVTPPSDPEKEGYSFAGWFSEAACTNAFDFSTPITANVSLYAKWVEQEADLATYTVTFMSDNSEYASQTVKAGQRVAAPTDAPTKQGNLFAGWYANEACTVPFDFSVPIAKDTTVYAKWVVQYFDVTFVTGGEKGVESQLVAYGGKASQPTDPTLEGSAFAGWYTDADCKTAFNFDSTTITEDTVVYAKWQVRVTFDSNGGSEISTSPQTIERHGKAMKPADPAKDNHTFGGWFAQVCTLTAEEKTQLEAELANDPSMRNFFWIEGSNLRMAFDFDEAIDTNTTLYARWIPASHTVTFNANGGAWDASQADTVTVTHGEAVSAPTTDPTRAHYTFKGWCTDAACTTEYEFATPVAGDVTLYANWEAITHKVEFATGGGSAVDTQTVQDGDKPTRPTTDPTKDGYTFAGWYTDRDYGTEFDFEAPVTQNTTAVAKWDLAPQKVTITFDANMEGVEDPASQTIDANAVPTKPTDPSKQYAEFKGWYYDVDGDVDAEILAMIEADPELADVCWVVDGKLRIAYDFGEESFGFDEDTTLYARWSQESYTVTFIDGGSELSTQTVLAGETATAPAIEDEDDDGFTFLGWYTDDESAQEYDFNTPVTSDLELYAIWEVKSFSVSFNSEGGSTEGLETQQVEYMDMATVPADPTKFGCTFAGWYADLGTRLSDEVVAELEEDYSEVTDLLWQTESTTLVKHDLAEDPVTSDLDLHARWVEGTLTTEVVVGEGAPNVAAPNLRDAALATLSSDEVAQGAHVWLQSNALSDKGAPAEDLKLVNEYTKKNGLTTATLFDLSLYKRVGGDDAEAVAIHKTKTPVKLAVDVPEAARNGNKDVTRTFYLLRVHDGEVAQIASGTNTTLEGESDSFSTYVIAYRDASTAAHTSAARMATARTGDATSWMGVVVLGLAGLAALALALVKRRA